MKKIRKKQQKSLKGLTPLALMLLYISSVSADVSKPLIEHTLSEALDYIFHTGDALSSKELSSKESLLSSKVEEIVGNIPAPLFLYDPKKPLISLKELEHPLLFSALDASTFELLLVSNRLEEFPHKKLIGEIGSFFSPSLGCISFEYDTPLALPIKPLKEGFVNYYIDFESYKFTPSQDASSRQVDFNSKFSPILKLTSLSIDPSPSSNIYHASFTKIPTYALSQVLLSHDLSIASQHSLPQFQEAIFSPVRLIKLYPTLAESMDSNLAFKANASYYPLKYVATLLEPIKLSSSRNLKTQYLVSHILKGNKLAVYTDTLIATSFSPLYLPKIEQVAHIHPASEKFASTIKTQLKSIEHPLAFRFSSALLASLPLSPTKAADAPKLCTYHAYAAYELPALFAEELARSSEYIAVASVNKKSSVLGVQPKIESSTLIKKHYYPDLSNLYVQLAGELTPFSLKGSYFLPLLKVSSDIETTYILDRTILLGINTAALEYLDLQKDLEVSYQQQPLLTYSFSPDNQNCYYTPSFSLSKNVHLLPELYPDHLAFTLASNVHPLIELEEICLDKQPLSRPDIFVSLENETKNYSHHFEAPTKDPHLTAYHPDSEANHSPHYFSKAFQDYKLSIDASSKYPATVPLLATTASVAPHLATSYTDLCPSNKTAVALNQSSRNVSKNLEELPTLEQLHTISFSDEFTCNIEVIPNTKEEGYLFAITLEPTHKQALSATPHNFIFLIDRSGAIDKNRFQTFKQAVAKSLLYLKEDDTFNIMTFDHETVSMSRESVYVSSSTKHAAKRFLESQKKGFSYVLPNLYNVLLEAHALAKTSSLPTSVVLLTNGKMLENFNPQDHLLSELVSSNKGNFSLFTACVSQNNNTLMLELLSTLNRGEMLYSETHAAFPRKLASLVKHANSLIAQDIHINAAVSGEPLAVEFYPETSLSPNLYIDRPYTILGKINKLEDFDLVLQGRFCNNWLNVTKKISFKTATKGGHSLYRDYSIALAYNKYKEFLKDGNTACLNEAKQVLQPFKSCCNN